MTKEIRLRDIEDYLKALHCRIRWDIIEILRDGPKSSDEIFNRLVSNEENNPNSQKPNCEGQCLEGKGKDIKKPTLYYHLRELEAVGIISVDQLKPSEHGRAPEKVWKLNTEKLIINLK